MNFSATVRKSGKLFSASAGLIAEAQMRIGIERATDRLRGAIQSAAPVNTGSLRAGIVKAGSGLGRRVQATEWYAVPIEAGARAAGLNARGRAQVATWAASKLGLDPTQARRFSFAWSRKKRGKPVRPNKFFLGTFDRLRDVLHRTYLAPVGIAVVREMDR